MKTTLQTIFYSTGVYQHPIAGRIFIDAVIMAAEDPFRLTSITANIYEPLAKQYHSNVACKIGRASCRERVSHQV